MIVGAERRSQREEAPLAASTLHFKVGNGDMLLIRTGSGRWILVDINICAPDDPTDERPDVGAQLRELLPRDAKGRLYVDAFLLTHPDQDHCRGLRAHFHLGSADTWSRGDDKILIREMWSSPVIFRRASKEHALCEDARAWAREARRRVALVRAGGAVGDGERITILGEDVDGKTDDLAAILVKVGQTFRTICGVTDATFQALLLAPLPAADADEETLLSKNQSSVVLNLGLAAGDVADAAKYLLGGDAEVAVWERVWTRNKEAPSRLEYDVLIAPHHCSWRSLSRESWSEFGEAAAVSPDARSALSRTRGGAVVLASSKPIEDDDDDPPCIRAKREYVGIAEAAGGDFTCLADVDGPEPYAFEITAGGPRPVPRRRPAALARPYIGGAAGAATGSPTALGAQPFKHG